MISAIRSDDIISKDPEVRRISAIFTSMGLNFNFKGKGAFLKGNRYILMVASEKLLSGS